MTPREPIHTPSPAGRQERSGRPGGPQPAGQAATVLRETLQALAALDQGSSLLELAAGRSGAGGELAPLCLNTLYSICRWQPRFDWILGQVQPEGLRQRHRRLAYWLLCQRFCLSSLPAEAAADVAVDYARRQFHPKEAGFLNAVFHRLLDLPAADWLQRLDTAPEAVRSSLGPELWGQWAEDFGPATAAALGELLRQPAPTAFRLRQGKSLPPALLASLRQLPELPWSPVGMWEAIPGSGLFSHPEFRPADLYFQDPATLAAPALLEAQPGETLADLCCAPGGKALLLAEAMQGQGILFCLDRSEKRLERVRENLAGFARLCRIAAADATAPELAPASLDGALIDVPCSNTGVVRRRPDVRRQFRRDKLPELLALQRQILLAAAALVRPGGRLVYSTCSIEPAENRRQVEQFLEARPDYRLEQEVSLMPTGWHDGGYAVRLRRRPQE